MTSFSLKDTILSQLNSENIFLKFLKLDELPKGNFSSPFSDDKKPSFKVYKNGTFKCFSTGKQGDVFQFIADLNNLDCKSQYQDIAMIIAKEMQIQLQPTIKAPKHEGVGVNTQTNIVLQNAKDSIAKTDKPFKISVTIKEMSQADYNFWKLLGVDENVLQRYKVNAVSNFTFYSEKKQKDVTWKVYDYLAFCYNVNENFEIYIPNQPKKRQSKFFCNGLQKQDVFGLEQLPKDKVDKIIICAGKKDAIVTAARGFFTVSFRSENHLPTKEQIDLLQSHCNTLFVCYDNDQGGTSGTNNLIAQFKNILPIKLPININDLADYFQEFQTEDFQKIITATEKEKTGADEELTTIFHIAEKYLTDNYQFRYNSISLAIESKKASETDWSVCNENSLWLELQKKSIKVPLNSLIAILKSDFVPLYNPLSQYFKNLPIWEHKTDYITEFSKHVTLEENESVEQFEIQFKKWCVRAVKCAIIDNYFNKQAFILTDDGIGQNIGKTSWCRFLCPPILSEYIAQDIPENEKDARILFAKNFLVNLDELASLSRKEINKLKSYFTLDKINERLPYDRKNSIIPRVASFIGSTNMSTFLQDETGSVRWLCFIVKSIDWNYRTDFDINHLWSQAFFLANDKNFDSEMGRDDIRNNETRNAKFQIVSPEVDLIREHFQKATISDGAEFLTSTAILHHLNLQIVGIRLSSVGIGKALTSSGYLRSKHNGVYGYWIKKKSNSTLGNF